MDIELQKFIWTLWLHGGPPTFGDDDFDYSSAASALSHIGFDSVIKNTTLFPICMVVCDQFGGKVAVAEIALLSAFRAMMSNDKSLISTGLPAHIGVLVTFTTLDLSEQITKYMYQLGGVPIVILGLTTMVEAFRDLLTEESTGTGNVVGLGIGFFFQLATRNYRRIEQLVRSGILKLLVTLNPSKDDLPDDVVIHCKHLTRVIPHFFAYNSVIELFMEPMRWATTGEDAPEARMSDGPLASAWLDMQATFLERYCLKRLFGACVGSSSNLTYCNNVGSSSISLYIFYLPNVPRYNAVCES